MRPALDDARAPSLGPVPAVLLVAVALSACAPSGGVQSAFGSPLPLSAVAHDPPVTPYQFGKEFNNQSNPTPQTFQMPGSGDFVAQFVSGFCNTTGGVPVGSILITGGGAPAHYLAPNYVREFDQNGVGTETFTHAATFYVNAGAQLQFQAYPTTTPAALATCVISVSGYLVTP